MDRGIGATKQILVENLPLLKSTLRRFESIGSNCFDNQAARILPKMRSVDVDDLIQIRHRPGAISSSRKLCVLRFEAEKSTR